MLNEIISEGESQHEKIYSQICSFAFMRLPIVCLFAAICTDRKGCGILTKD